MGLERDRIPRLRSVQNYVNYYSKTQLGYNDDHDDITEAVRAMAYGAGQDESTPISFTYGKTPEGQLVVGDGSDEEPFMVGLTTKTMLASLDRDPKTFIFHIDETFKLSHVNYPVLVLGISDLARRFHLVAFCIVSQRIESVYTMALLAFRAIYTEVTGKQIRLGFVMGDAEDGQLNALEQVFRCDSDFVFLMCFFHVMKKVHERTKSLPDRVANAVLAQIYDMHFSSSHTELNQVMNYYLKQWSKLNELAVFSAYFKAQWLKSRYSRWPCCYMETNNPVEQFNRPIERDHTLRSRLKMGPLIKVLSECCANESHANRAFRMNPEPAARLLRRAKQLASDKLLMLGPEPTGSTPRCHLRVISRPVRRFFTPAKKRTVEYLAVTAQMGWNYARMEYMGQPPEGWLVDVSAGWCQCRSRESLGVVFVCSMVDFRPTEQAHKESEF